MIESRGTRVESKNSFAEWFNNGPCYVKRNRVKLEIGLYSAERVTNTHPTATTCDQSPRAAPRGILLLRFYAPHIRRTACLLAMIRP
jgi:hypothetical protein